MVWNVQERYYGSEAIVPLAFIHDELILEIKDDEFLYEHVDNVSELMIDSMKSELKHVRVTVEASVQDYWSKSKTIWDKTYWKDFNSNQLRSS